MTYKFLKEMDITKFPRMIPGILLLIYGLIALGYLTVISWSVPILDMYGFRQTQTALSIYWMEKGGSLIAYQTPVVGYPWSIPFEFPIYQWLAALLGTLTGLSVDQSGRVTGIIFFLGAAVVLYKIIARLTDDRAFSLVCTGAFLSSPIAIFWARSVMIESAALFFSLAFLYGVTQYHLTSHKRFILTSIFFAICAALVKITTFYGFAILLALVLVSALIRDFATPRFKQALRTSVIAGFAVVISLVILIVWIRYSDELKQQTIIGSRLTSSAISNFNFGTLKQRLDIGSWETIIFGRAVYQILGSGWILLGAAGILAFNSTFRWAGIFLLVGYLAPFMTFTNLQYVHTYYQFANFTFLSTLVGLAIGSLTKRGVVGLVTAGISVIVVGLMSWHVLNVYFIPSISVDQSRSRTIELARFIRTHTKENEALLIFGMDWSSELPYYALRKAVVVPDWVPVENLKLVLNPEKSFGAERLGALVVCPNSLASSETSKRRVYEAVITQYMRDRRVQMVGGCQVGF